MSKRNSLHCVSECQGQKFYDGEKLGYHNAMDRNQFLKWILAFKINDRICSM